MEVFAEYLARIDNPQHRARTEEILAWVANKFPNLEPQIKWNKPTFTDHGTYIIMFATAKNHLSILPEEETMVHFADEIAQAGYSASSRLFRIKWTEPVNYELLEKIIEFNIKDKAGCSTFWRK
ncbi:iron chaperone [Polycladomyces sp. WAk]|uniref:Iron chaperone n=1 Tax=Polycladomyces zharkentensis TaxID=2807616 RepID=A0ABS2WML4_9BACL|nr:iron chaperone [Polycladomyces sp. WAk]MBN2910752.1 iron chaperone [Polycladomyces sp. WAk]